MRLIPLACAPLACAVLAGGPALAGHGLSCDAPNADVSFQMALGYVSQEAGYGFSHGHILVEDRIWTLHGSHPGAVELAISPRTPFNDADGVISLDFLDAETGDPVAAIRLLHVDGTVGFAGTLEMPGIGIWGLICGEYG